MYRINNIIIYLRFCFRGTNLLHLVVETVEKEMSDCLDFGDELAGLGVSDSFLILI